MDQNIKNIVMRSQLLSTQKKLLLLQEIRKNSIEKDKLNLFLSRLLDGEQKLEEAKNKYYRNMDKIYKEYLEKNINQLSLDISKLKIATAEKQQDEAMGDIDSILDEI